MYNSNASEKCSENGSEWKIEDRRLGGKSNASKVGEKWLLTSVTSTACTLHYQTEGHVNQLVKFMFCPRVNSLTLPYLTLLIAHPCLSLISSFSLSPTYSYHLFCLLLYIRGMCLYLYLNCFCTLFSFPALSIRVCVMFNCNSHLRSPRHHPGFNY